MRLSICIPTYNRARHLRNCLRSIASSGIMQHSGVEVCISDNGSSDDTAQIVEEAKQLVPLRYERNQENLGIPANFLKVVDMATGEFAWLVGDDDLLMPEALKTLLELIEKHPHVDFFYVNSFHLTTEFVLSHPQPFDVSNLPSDMQPFSTRKKDGELAFFDLIDPKISFDFLGGMFLSVFRREKWLENAGVLNAKAIKDMRTFAYFDNTFPHVKIFAKAFSGSRAYFQSKPLSVCLSGAREWAPMYPLVRSVRLIEALDEYRGNGMSLWRYLECRNFALRYFIPDLVYMILRREVSGVAYIKPFRLLAANAVYPNSYLSLFLYFVRKAKRLIMRLSPSQGLAH
ncbi:MAG: glycosyltransferase [Candidatus Protistobacter heckmanni]|nr:glycosyltransferase [Candidatus Protistobacter heckmanni]